MKCGLRHAMTVGLLASTITAIAQTSNRTHRYLFIGHPRDDVPPTGPAQIVQRPLERLDLSGFDLLMLGGDLTWTTTGSRDTVAYVDALFSIHDPSRLLAFGNHDDTRKDYITDVTGRPPFYAVETNSITFVVLDTTDAGQDILDGELTMLRNTVAALSNSTHLVLIHHHFIWMADYAPLAHLIGDNRIGASSKNLSGLNFYDEVYPLLLDAQTNGVQVICVGGDRTGDIGQEFHIEHTTSNGIHYLAAGLKEELPPDQKSVIVFDHNEDSGDLTWSFTHLAELPLTDSSPVIVSEIHYHPPDTQGDDAAFIELYNRSPDPVDLSNVQFVSGVTFTFPDGVSLPSGDHVVVAANSNRYAHLGGRVFDWDGNERPPDGAPIQLRRPEGFEVDYVPYESTPPWPSSPDGRGPSLALIETSRDNERPSNWWASDVDTPTPGEANFTLPSPAALSASTSSIDLAWSGIASGGLYRLYCTTQLLQASWQPLGALITARTDAATFSVTSSPAVPRRFYRLGRTFE